MPQHQLQSQIVDSQLMPFARDNKNRINKNIIYHSPKHYRNCKAYKPFVQIFADKFRTIQFMSTQ